MGNASSVPQPSMPSRDERAARQTMPSGDERAVPRPSIPSGSESVVVLPHRMSFRLLEEITNHFSEDRKLGASAYEPVYMGEHRNGEKIVVKVLRGHPELDDTQFEKKCLHLASLQHRNIVRLVGYCHETECVKYNGSMVFAKRTKMALCSEYMHNGSIYDCLSDESSGHDWPTRYAIIRGVCDGLKYIHEDLEIPVYMDLKPQNILLDEKLVPKFTNFCLSNYYGDALGYLPLEYMDVSIMSNKFDIFSLGVTILTIMAGPKGHSRSAVMSPHVFIEDVHGNWRNRLQKTSVYEVESYCKQVKACAEIALSCVEADRHKRPAIGIIVNKLKETETLGQKIVSLQNDLADLTATWLSCNPAPSVSTASSSVTIGSPSHPRVSASMGSTVFVPPPPLVDPFNSLLRGPSQPPLSTPQLKTEPNHQYLSLKYLKEITEDFAIDRILGRGACGVVYKGVLQNGEIVAVKKVESMLGSAEKCEIAKKQFENEVYLLMGLKHPNIVQLLGHCYEMQHEILHLDGKPIFSWHIYSLLSLEYMPNGSLDGHISDATQGLDWPTRYKIIEGVSSGIQCLHEQSDAPIIHMDLKAANILLDANMLPKIADFGISRLYDKGQTILTETTTGTLGYMPPEFFRGSAITPMADIFSLGVIIMEVITGHREYPYDLRATSEEFTNTELLKWIDAMEKKPWNTNIMTYCRQIEKCIQIGLMCVNPDRTKRPPIRNVINMLQGLESPTCYSNSDDPKFLFIS